MIKFTFTQVINLYKFYYLYPRFNTNLNNFINLLLLRTINLCRKGKAG